MSTLELQDAINQLEQRCLDMIAGAEKEVRKLTEAEDTQLNELKKELEEKRSQLTALQDELSKNQNQKSNQTNRNSMEKFSIRQAILESVENRQLSEQTVTLKDVAMRSMQDAAIQATGQLQFPISTRGIDGTAGKGKELVFDEAAGFLFPITEGSVLSKLGARFITGIKGNMVFTSSDGVTSDWKPEGQESTDGSGNFSNVTMKPKRLCCQIPIAKSVLIQSSYDVEMMIRKMIADKIAESIDVAFFDGHVSDVNKPDSILSVTGVNSITCAAGKVNEALIDMESAVKGYGNLTYVSNPVARGTMKKTKLTEGKFVCQDNEVNGYPLLATRAITNDKAVVMGDFSEVNVGVWGDGLDIQVDTATLAGKGMVRVVVNFYADVVCTRPETFAKTVLA